MRLLTVTTILFALVLISCASTVDKNTQKTRYSHNLISAEEIQANPANDAYDLIYKLRPHWIQGRGANSLHNKEASYPVVYVNESKHGSIESLSSISARHISKIQFLKAGEATFRFGLNHTSGAILIKI